GYPYAYGPGTNATYLFADNAHPSGVANRILADLVIATISASAQVDRHTMPKPGPGFFGSAVTSLLAVASKLHWHWAGNQPAFSLHALLRQQLPPPMALLSLWPTAPAGLTWLEPFGGCKGWGIPVWPVG
ncbi:hypothetical protein, partial [Candidatus Synechococcus spongiarum]